MTQGLKFLKITTIAKNSKMTIDCVTINGKELKCGL